MDVIKSRRGNDMVVNEGYIFSRDKPNKNGTVAFKCTIKSCSSRGVATGDMVNFQQSGEHNHPPDYSKIEIMKRKNELKTKVKEQPTTSLKRLYNEAFADVQENDDFSNVPSFN